MNTSSNTQESRENGSPFSVERVDGSNLAPDLLKELTELDRRASEGTEEELDVEDGESILSNPRGIHLVVRNGKAIIGYMTALPEDESYSLSKGGDPLVIPTSENMYIEAMVIDPAYRGLKPFFMLTKQMIASAKEGGYVNISTHARTTNGFSEIIQKKFGGVFQRAVDNYFDTGETFDYLLIPLANL